jgi:hypothetical protein
MSGARSWAPGRRKGVAAVNIGEPSAPLTGESSQQKTCPVCGARFGCMAAQQACWCAEVVLSKQETADLRVRFTDCLCPGCLRLSAEREVRQERAKSPAEKPAR